MPSRLPTPGADGGSWGTILNDFLSVVHSGDGTLKASVVSTAALIDGSVTAAKAASDLMALIDAKYTKPASGIPASDINPSGLAATGEFTSSFVSINDMDSERESRFEGLVMWNGVSWSARPDAYARIRWVGGTTRPPGMISGDVWEHDI